MSRRKKKNGGSGTDKRKLAAEETPVAGHEVRGLAADDAVMQTEANNSSIEPIEPSDAGASGQAAPAPADTRQAASSHGSLGQRLRAAREAKGWTVEEVGGRLRLPVQIIQTLESEQYEKIGYGIYLRGYLTSYARLVDVPTVLIEPVLRDHGRAPQLVTSGTIPHSRYLYQRYSVSALYLILTGVIIVPAVLLAMRAGMEPGLPQLNALDGSSVTAPVAERTSPAGSAGVTTGVAPAASTAARPASDTPLVASIAPFQALSRKDEAASPPAPQAPAAAPPGAHTLALSLSEPSWVEVTTAAGEKLEYGLLPAGTVRKYSSAQALDVRLGNCSGAQIETDGQAQDLTPYRRANVAHFKLFSGDQAISRAD